jgi:glycosyltransferase involved in cell wall biosynthesis
MSIAGYEGVRCEKIVFRVHRCYGENVKVAFIHTEKKVGTGAHYINDLMSHKLQEAGVEMKNFYPRSSFDAPNHLKGLKNILFFHSLLEKRKEIATFDLIQGTTYTPLPFLECAIPVIAHFGSTTKGFLQATPRAFQMEPELRKIWHTLRNKGAIAELNTKTRRPLRDIAEIEEYVALKSEAVIATSLNVKKELLDMGVEAQKIHLIHNAIEDYWFNKRRPSLAGTPHIVFLGRMGGDVFSLKLKGVDRLIHLYAHFADVKKVTVCMTTNTGIIAWFQNIIPNHQLFVNVKKDTIPGLIQNLRGSILFIPSRYEGFSLSLVEGMSQGLVPVVYPVGVAPEIVKNGENGFIVSSQKEAIEKVRLLLTDANLRLTCSRSAEKSALQFSSSRIAKKLMKLYKAVDAQAKCM